MRFIALTVKNKQRIFGTPIGDRVTHVRLNRLAIGDTEQARRVLDHIRAFADEDGVAEIARFATGFPARQPHRGARRAMESELRHYANERDAGRSELNKGFLDLGWME